MSTDKSYYGCCGFCKYMKLYSGSTWCYSTTFDCEERNFTVKADEKACSKFVPDPNRTNDMIAEYDK